MEPRAQDSGSGLLLLHQIQAVHSCNEYTESPTTWPCPRNSASAPDEGAVPGPVDHPQNSPQIARRSTDTGLSSEHGTMGQTSVKGLSEKFEQEVQKGLYTISTQEPSVQGNLGAEVTSEEEQTGIFGGSLISEHNLGSVSKLDVAVEQPKRCNSKQEELLGAVSTDRKHLNLELKHETTTQHSENHPSPCVRCSRCKCMDCTTTTPLPTCWLCGRRCLCSAETVVEYTTCVCCLKALLYHCSSDDEDSSSDVPFSCHKSRRCTRWSIAAGMAFVLPCLLCYGPARGCLTLCQLCLVRTHRTGCRCKSQHLSHSL